MASLAEQIKDLAHPKPANFDPEEDDFDTTRATLVKKGEDHDLDDKNLDSSALRTKNISLLSDEDAKYHGRRVSRVDMARMRGDFMDSDESVDELEDGDKSDEESLDSKFDDEIKIDPEEHSDKDDEDSKQESDDDEDDEEDDDEDDDDKDGTDDADILSSRLEDNENQDAGINRFSASNVEDEIEKGMAVQHQQNLWDTFLEYRIRLQKAVVLANKLPQHDVSESFTDNDNQKPGTLQGKKALSDLLYKLLIIQEKLLDQNPDTRKTLYPSAKNGVNKDDEDDEEIPSDSENEEKEEQDNGKTETDVEYSLKLPLKRKAGF
ncbi:hypothetical protein QZH41_016219, partial [Actinostola sp. cb2023]